jgi:hypothetical protein
LRRVSFAVNSVMAASIARMPRRLAATEDTTLLPRGCGEP